MRIAFRRDWIARKGDPAKMSLIRVSGDSMQPTLEPGDIVLIDHNRVSIAQGGGLYALAIDHGVMVKRLDLDYTTRMVSIISDNPRYPTRTAEPERVAINGRVIWYGRESSG